MHIRMCYPHTSPRAVTWPLQDIVSLRGFIAQSYFFANTPFIVQYIAQYYQLLHPPAQF